MNFLAHFFLAEGCSETMAGNFLGDFIKGPLDRTIYPPKIAQGIRTHRAVDGYADRHPMTGVSAPDSPTGTGESLGSSSMSPTTIFSLGTGSGLTVEPWRISSIRPMPRWKTTHSGCPNRTGRSSGG